MTLTFASDQSILPSRDLFASVLIERAMLDQASVSASVLEGSRLLGSVVKGGVGMRRKREQSFLPLMIQLVGLEPVEQRLVDAWMSFGHRAQRFQLRTYRALPIAAVSAVLVLYAAGAVALAVRKFRSAGAVTEAEPTIDQPSMDTAETAVAEAAQTVV